MKRTRGGTFMLSQVMWVITCELKCIEKAISEQI